MVEDGLSSTRFAENIYINRLSTYRLVCSLSMVKLISYLISHKGCMIPWDA